MATLHLSFSHCGQISLIFPLPSVTNTAKADLFRYRGAGISPSLLLPARHGLRWLQSRATASLTVKRAFVIEPPIHEPLLPSTLFALIWYSLK